jgi:hypothetical protein
MLGLVESCNRSNTINRGPPYELGQPITGHFDVDASWGYPKLATQS